MTAIRTPRGEYAKTADRRREILDAAVEVFSASGFRNGSLRDVANRVGLSQAGILHHFPSKNALLSAVLERRDEQTLEAANRNTPRGIELFRAMRNVVEENTATRALVELHVLISAEGTSSDHPANEYFLRRYRVVVETVRVALEEAAEDGHLSPGVEPAATARMYIALLDGLQVQWLLDPDSVDMSDVVQRFTRMVFSVEL
jgi:AcrR family transcriptional regulator